MCILHWELVSDSSFFRLQCEILLLYTYLCWLYFFMYFKKNYSKKEVKHNLGLSFSCLFRGDKLNINISVWPWRKAFIFVYYNCSVVLRVKKSIVKYLNNTLVVCRFWVWITACWSFFWVSLFCFYMYGVLFVPCWVYLCYCATVLNSL